MFIIYVLLLSIPIGVVLGFVIPLTIRYRVRKKLDDELKKIGLTRKDIGGH